MRPALLQPLFARVGGLAGVGPKTATAFGRLLGAGPDGEGARVVDLLFHLPSGLVDRRARPRIAEAVPGEVATIEVVVEEHRPPPPGRRHAPHRVITGDGTGWLTLVFFHGAAGHAERLLPVGARRWVSGRLEQYDGMLQMVHPDRILDEAGLARLPPIEATYPLVEGVVQGAVQRATRAALERLPALPEWLDGTFLERRRWPGFAEALRRLHLPETPQDLAPDSPWLARLAYDELLASQLALVLVRRALRRTAGRVTVGDGRVARAVEAALPFALTGSQERALEEIRRDMASGERMIRLLQGDVGSGKTVVALLAMATAIEGGRQAALMAPTEILARQHFATIKGPAEAAGLSIAILTGRDKGRERERIVAAAAAGELDIVVGTHALVQEGVSFRDLGLAVVDEQHRFGVHQRLALTGKGEAVDLLVMTATPIPRTLVLTYFGDMDVSQLTEKPAGRKPVDTRLVALDRLDEVVEAVGRAVASGARVYWVCPLVEESETLDVAAAEERYRELDRTFPGWVALVHGRMRGSDKDRALARFAAGEASVLVATTVIEVGVDVPDATVIVIEHAERFGLAQLHQLRGRVGRGAKPSTCLLLYRKPLGETAKARLETLRATDDGFKIAEEDLRLRGEGDLLGTRQSGLPGFRIARPEVHGELLETARKDASLVVTQDPDLTGPRGRSLRVLLHLFEKEEAARLLEAG